MPKKLELAGSRAGVQRPATPYNSSFQKGFEDMVERADELSSSLTIEICRSSKESIDQNRNKSARLASLLR